MPGPPTASESDNPQPRESGLSKTLDNGLQILELLVRNPQGLSLTEVADGVGVHRTVAHRLVRTLEARRLCHRDASKRITLGNGLVRLAEPVEQDLRALARPVLEELTDATNATAHLVVRENDTQVRMLMIVEPRHARMHVSFHAGQIDPIDRGSAGLAILAARPPQAGERAEVTRAREQGFAVSHGEIAPAITGISAPVPNRPGTRPVSLGLSLFDAFDEEELGRTVTDAANRLDGVL